MTERGRAGLLAVAFAVATAGAVVLVVFNRGQPIAIGVGPVAWRGEAIYAVYAAAIAGLVVMFLVGLPSDLAARRERRRLESRVRDLVREREEARKDRDDEDAADPTRVPRLARGSRGRGERE